jgi:ribonuclease P/MRP protein subunit POP5
MVRVKNRYLVVNYLYPTTSNSSKLKDARPGDLQFHQPTPDEFHAGKLVRAIQDGVTELFGDYGLGMVSTSLKGNYSAPLIVKISANKWPVNYHSTATSTSIVRCPQAHYEMVWAALTFMTHLPRPSNTPVVVKVVRVTGTIRKAEEEIIKRAKEIILRAKLSDGGAGDVGFIKDIMNAVEKRREAEVLVEEEDDGEDESGSE